MALKRNVSLSSALVYKGHGPFLAYIMHRLGGARYSYSSQCTSCRFWGCSPCMP